jgi:hypothetical protein
MSKSQAVSLTAVLAVIPAAVAGAFALAGSSPPPAAGPHFSTPLAIDNPFAPFVVGGSKSYEGSNGSAVAEVTDEYLSATRAFVLEGQPVECRQLVEIDYEDGVLHEISQNFFAQDDDGSVWYFGETVDNYVDGQIDNHEGSWLVGGPTDPADPIETATAAQPGLFMPAAPQPGDHWKPENLFPIVDETVTLLKAGLELELVAGDFEGVILTRETSLLQGSTPERKWYAPGVGVVLAKGAGESLELVAAQGFPLAHDPD